MTWVLRITQITQRNSACGETEFPHVPHAPRDSFRCGLASAFFHGGMILPLSAHRCDSRNFWPFQMPSESD